MPVGLAALLLAGRRPGVDPLAAHYGVEDKVLIPVAGQAMLARVAQTLVSYPSVGQVLIAAQDPVALFAHPDTQWMAQHEAIRPLPGPASVSAAVAAALDQARGPLLVTTADNVLLDHAMLDQFLREAPGADVAAALVERRTLEAAFPGNRRTWLPFRGGAWSGANLFWFAGPQARPVLNLWQGIERDRKKGRKIIGAFGPVLMLGALLRLLTIDQAVARAGRRLGVTARVVAMDDARACIDADKPDDITLIETILRDGQSRSPQSPS